jgi:hypothetical protein
LGHPSLLSGRAAFAPFSVPHSVASFRTWLASRPHEKHWELIAGIPLKTTTVERRRRRIASNLESPTLTQSKITT